MLTGPYDHTPLNHILLKVALDTTAKKIVMNCPPTGFFDLCIVTFNFFQPLVISTVVCVMQKDNVSSVHGWNKDLLISYQLV